MPQWLPWESTVLCSLNVVIGPASAVTQWGSAGSRSTAANIATYQLLTFVTHLNKQRLLGKWEWAAGCQCQNCTLSKLGRRVFCHLNSHITVHWRKAVKMFLDRFIFTFRWKMKIYAMLRKSAEKKPQLMNIIPCILGNWQIQKNIPSNFHQTVAAMMNFNWTNIFSKLLGNHHRATNVY